MKRYNHLFERICDIQNIELADLKARRNKKNNWGIVKHDKHILEDNLNLQKKLSSLTYLTSKYTTYKIYEPKERVIFRLPYYPDRITHHAIMNIMEDIWVKTFINNTYSCIKERGIHKLTKDLKKALKDTENTKYCLKLDITKFYPSINHKILKEIIKRKIKDRLLLTLLEEIIDSAEGVPIGNYLSQFFANLYLTYFDHWMKELVGIKYYYRYADDIVILSPNKKFLHNLLIAIKFYLKLNLKLSIKSNYQIFPVEARGIDFVGYKFYHTHVLLRKSIKIKLNKLIIQFQNSKINKNTLELRLNSYFGWLKYCDSKNLLKKIFKTTDIYFSNWCGIQENISSFYNKNIYIIEVISHKKYFEIHFIYNNIAYTIKSLNKKLFLQLLKIKDNFPTNFKIKPYVRNK